MKRYATREEWLNAAVNHILAIGQEEIPEFRTDRKIRVSCGLPSKGAFSSKRRIGECWHEDCTTDGYNEIYVSPTLCNPGEVFATLLHEVCHVVAGLEAGHGKAFKRIASKVGLVGKMTATRMDEEAEAWAAKIVDRHLGTYPHGALSGRPDPTKKKQSTRLLKAECLNEQCGYNFRISKKQAERGLPNCPVCENSMIVEGMEEEEGEE